MYFKLFFNFIYTLLGYVITQASNIISLTREYFLFTSFQI